MLNSIILILIFACFPIFPQQDHPTIHQTQLEQFSNINIPVEPIKVLNGLDLLFTNHLELIKGKNIGLVTNHTGLNRDGIPNYELLMHTPTIFLKAIFAPEHGFFGDISAGQKIDDQRLQDFPVIYSLYGNTRKPTPEMFKGLDIIIYDIQDVGARFYTYISTLGLVMEAAAEAGIKVVVLDRPNPLGGTVEGPVLDLDYSSFIGMYPIPIRYGLTVGELALMIAGEKWISTIPELHVFKMEGWKRQIYFDETDLNFIPPSPNIPNVETAIIYSGTCLIEGTNISEGRGTDHPFKWIGAPWIDGQKLAESLQKKQLPGVLFESKTFTPVSIPGKALQPKYENELCQGVEVKISDKHQYQSVLTGVMIIMAIHDLYPNDFKLLPSFNKLWGEEIQTAQGDFQIEQLFNPTKNDIEEFIRQAEIYKLYP